jgi:hypothetical protein
MCINVSVGGEKYPMSIDLGVEHTKAKSTNMQVEAVCPCRKHLIAATYYQKLK